jgi:hypothetical protein
MQKIILYFCCLALLGPALSAQQDLGIHFMQGVWQSNLTNPANLPSHKVVLALPGFYNQTRVDNFNYNDVVRTDNQGNTTIDLNNVIDKMDVENIIRQQVDIPTVSLGMRINQIFLQIGHSFHVNGYLDYPKELAQVVWQGNAQFIGQTVDIGPDVLFQAYNSFFLGAAGEIAPGVVIGGRFKVLSGTADLSTQNRSLQLTTDSEIYQSTINADYVINSTGLINYDGFNSNTAIDFSDDNLNFDRLVSSNYGLAFDLGVRANFGQWSFAASALDLGSITWREDATNTRLQGNYEFKGLDILKEVLLDSASTISIADTLEALYQVEETTSSYSTALPSKFYFSASIQATDTWSIGALAYIERYREIFQTTVGVNANAQLTNFLSVGGIYSFTDAEPFRLGANAAIRFGPVQLVAATDNLITAFRLEDSNSANFRLGLNLVFGKVRRDIDPDKIGNQDDFFN